MTFFEINATKFALEAGCDIDSGGAYEFVLTKSLKNGNIPVDIVDRALYNSLKMRFELGLFDPNRGKKIKTIIHLYLHSWQISFHHFFYSKNSR